MMSSYSIVTVVVCLLPLTSSGSVVRADDPVTHTATNSVRSLIQQFQGSSSPESAEAGIPTTPTPQLPAGNYAFEKTRNFWSNGAQLESADKAAGLAHSMQNQRPNSIIAQLRNQTTSVEELIRSLSYEQARAHCSVHKSTLKNARVFNVDLSKITDRESEFGCRLLKLMRSPSYESNRSRDELVRLLKEMQQPTSAKDPPLDPEEFWTRVVIPLFRQMNEQQAGNVLDAFLHELPETKFVNRGWLAKPLEAERYMDARALHFAIESTRGEPWKAFIARKVDLGVDWNVRKRHSDGETALIQAVRGGNVAAVQDLLDKRLLSWRNDIVVNAKLTDDARSTALHVWAAIMGHEQETQTMFEAFQNTETHINEQTNDQGKTALHIAVERHNVAAVVALCSTVKNLFIDQRDFEGNTALHRLIKDSSGSDDAVSESRFNTMFDALVTRGANTSLPIVDQVTRRTWTALQAAKEAHNHVAVDALGRIEKSATSNKDSASDAGF